MTDYNVKFTDATKDPIVVPQDAEIAQGTDLRLFGRSFLEYGKQLNENLLRLLENFACPELPASDPPTPQLSAANDTLGEPVEGQLWYNTTRTALYQFDGSSWFRLSAGSDYAANWGQITDSQYVPRPVGSDGYVFPYSECIWLVSPGGHSGRFDYMACTTDSEALVTMKYRLLGSPTMTSGNANYLIIGIRGNTNLGTYGVLPPGITPTPTPTVGSSPTPTPASSPAASAAATPTPTPTVTRTPTPTPTNGNVTPTPTPAPSPTPSPRPPLSVQFVDSARGGAYSDSLSLCDIAEHYTVRDYGMIGCSTTFDMCPVNQCAPEPGTYVGGSGAVGPEMGVTCSGGVAPYTVRFKNFTATSGGANFLASGDCVFISGGTGFKPPVAGVVHTVVVPTNGGTVSGLAITASCGNGEYTMTGNFTVEVTDAIGAVVSATYPYTLQRTNTSPITINSAFIRAERPENYFATTRVAYVLSNTGESRRESSQTGTTVGQWLVSGSASNYEVFVVKDLQALTAGFVFGTYNTWLNLGTTQSWGIQVAGGTGTATNELILTVSIRRVGTTTILDTAEISFLLVVGEVR